MRSALQRLGKIDIDSTDPRALKQLVKVAVDEEKSRRGPRITFDDPRPDILRALSDVIRRERRATTALVDDRVRAKCAKVGVRMANDATIGELVDLLDRINAHGRPDLDYPPANRGGRPGPNQGIDPTSADQQEENEEEIGRIWRSGGGNEPLHRASWEHEDHARDQPPEFHARPKLPETGGRYGGRARDKRPSTAADSFCAAVTKPVGRHGGRVVDRGVAVLSDKPEIHARHVSNYDLSVTPTRQLKALGIETRAQAMAADAVTKKAAVTSYRSIKGLPDVQVEYKPHRRPPRQTMRASELRGLRWPDVDFGKAEINVRQRADRYGTIGPPKSKSGERTIPIGPFVVNTLREWRLACPHDLVFPNGAGNIERHQNIIPRVWWPVQVAAGVVDAAGKPKYTGLHSVRHFYASWCINPAKDGGLGLAAKAVQERLGHSSIVMTMDVYGHLFPRTDDGSELAAAEGRLLRVVDAT